MDRYSIGKYKKKRNAIVKILKSEATNKLVGDAAADVAARAMRTGSGYYGSRTKLQRYAWKGYAYTGNWAAMKDNAEHDTLSKSI